MPVEEVVGAVAGRVPIIVDDMMTTAGTVEAAVRALRAAGAAHEVRITATHGVFADVIGRQYRDEPMGDLLAFP